MPCRSARQYISRECGGIPKLEVRFFEGSLFEIQIHESREQNMKPATIIGVILIIVAIVGFAMGGISFTHQKKVVDMGPVQLSHKETDTLPISPILSTLALIVGAGLVFAGSRSR